MDCRYRYWDENSQRYVNNSNDDIFNCCTGLCDRIHKKCKKYCKKDQDCLVKCTTGFGNCYDHCELNHSVFGGQNIPDFNDCLGQSECAHLLQVGPDDKLLECVKKNRKSLLKCCNKNCIPKAHVDCTEHCNTAYNEFFKAFARKPTKILDPIMSMKQTKKDRSFIFYFVVLLSGGISIFGIILLIIFLKR